MINLSGYEISEQIFKSPETTVLRAKHISDNRKVIIKVLNNEYPAADRLENFRREYELTRRLTGDKVINMYSLDNFDNSLAIVMEDFDGKSLAEILKTTKFTLEEKLLISIDIADAIMQIHKQKVIHKDINPFNILLNINTKQIKIIDFGISTDLKSEKPQNLFVLEGTLPYISPEQTGKVNRAIDYRSDYYSLGVTLYEIFTGQLPFLGDGLEIAYSHIAKIPKEPKVVNNEIPTAISDIIMKLMAKNAEDRYQSIQGLKYDLNFCLENLESRQKLINFETAQKDFSDKFQLPEKLYGREKEIENLAKAFESLKSSELRLLLVAGYSGIGKTTIIKEFYRMSLNKSNYFISGKFNKMQKSNPYSAIILAFRELMRGIITEYTNIEKWKDILIEALGPNAKILIDLIPELGQIIGQHPEVPKLSPSEEKNRFLMVFRDFIRVFARKEHPLVIFLDDLQWCDFSTTDFLKYIITTIEAGNLLIIGSYRDNEINEEHPLLQMVDELKGTFGSDGFLNKILLEPLPEHVVNQMVADTLKRHYSDTYMLTNYIYRKTKGNAFFARQFLYSLHQKGAFKFDYDKHTWNWSLEELDEVHISDNVVEFLIQSLNMLPADSLKILKKASCIGNSFDLRTLYLICNEFENISDALWTIIDKDLIIPLNNDYRLLYMPKEELIKSSMDIRFHFSHDKIQQAAYSLFSDEEKLAIHQEIGKTLFESYTVENSIDSSIFEVINHLNIAKDLLIEKNERFNLMELNFKAGKQAKGNSAYDIAINHFNVGKSLLTKAEWKECPEKLFEFSYELTESNYLAGKIENSLDCCSRLLKSASNNIQKARAISLKAKILDNKGEKKALVIDEVRKGLKLLGVHLPEDAEQIDRRLSQGITKMQAYLDKCSIESFVNLPKMTDESRKMVMQLFFQVQPATFQYYPPLNFLIQIIMFDMALSYGTTQVSCKNIAECGIIYGPLLNNYDMAYRFGQTSFVLLEKLDAKLYKAGCYFIFATFISHWKAHYSESLNYFDMCLKNALETGDIEHAVYSCTHKLKHILYSGINLNDCRIEGENVLKFFKDVNISFLEPSIRIFLNFIKQLQSTYNYEVENSLLQEALLSQNIWLLCVFGQCNLISNYVLENFEAADRWNTFTQPYLNGGTGHFSMPDHIMFQSLVLIKKYEKSAENERQILVDSIVKNVEILKVWSDNCPSNFAHKYYLVCAELARVQNKSLESIVVLYNKALNSIAPGDFINMKALINELLGEFWINRDDKFIGKAYIKEAYYFYTKWGAFSKIRILEKKYAHFFTDFSKLNFKFASPNKKHINTKFTEALSLDLGSILKATQAISSEIKIDKLLKVLMNTIIENAGAQSGCLILKRETKNDLYVEALKSRDDEEIQVMQSIPFNDSKDFCPEIVQYVVRTRENIVIDNASKNPNFQNIKYVLDNKTKSVMCMPIIYQNDLKGIIYLENNLLENVFTIERLETLKIISSQITISIENAQLYENLEEKVRQRTEQLELANNELKELALHDPLTRLHNRRYVYEYITGLSESFVKSKAAVYYNRQKRDLSIGNNVIGIYLIDIDFFKNVNDTYGHATGDEVLIKITKVLKSLIRDDDYIVRWGGEEFLIILNKTKVEYLTVFSKKVLTLVSETPLELPEGKKIYITCSIGCTYLPFEPEISDLFTLEQTINISDFAMYKAKEKGRNRAVHVNLQNLNNLSREEIKTYLANLKRNSDVDDKFITIEEIE
ncbi:protein kinase domain-containing protein [Pseudobacteroides cellulosolvens]|uniref:Putative phytochrome sensor protein n=1 Tax=Pseudobacteroides cellulosolvens ATCC 35603 = DSM 2933 TaxID=398512 RepID=A0A0L6JWH2_9FIRM|nr:diguanylate cyclase [Pseudobacteroides cellulosolvens]KNY29772.1 putative phytochrome sensor protein [Pseudobacteroides cellulosolvens ATCC 35603 = DSM 2933]